MSLMQRLAHAPKGRGHTCSVGILLATWPVETRDGDYNALLAALRDPAWTGNAIARTLLEEGYTVNPKHIHQHRRGDCTSGNCPAPQIGRVTP